MEKLESEKEIIEDAGRETALVRRWLSEIKLYDDEFKDWGSTCDTIKRRFRDDKRDKRKGRFNIFWSNIENQKPSIFFRAPKVEVGRRNKDKDPVARVAAETLERAGQYSIDSYNFKKRVSKARDEFLLYGRGQARVRYIPVFREIEQPILDELGLPIMDEKGEFILEKVEIKVSERVECDFVHRNDFRHTAGARTWEEVTWVSFDSYLTRDQLIERFGEEKGGKVSLSYNPIGDRDDIDKSLFKKAIVHEIWDKESKKVYWISDGYKEGILDEQEDPLALKNFFPCPEPVYGSMDTDCLVPIPDFSQYEAISDELDQIGYRKSALVRALKVAGVYNKVNTEIAKLAQSGAELTLIPAENWSQLNQSGGLDKMIQWMPIEQIANVLRSLIDVEAQLKQALYEISGQSDLIRGATDPRETATAQGLKSQYANLRNSEKQDRFSQFVRDIIEIKAEIIAEQFDPETIFEIANIKGQGGISEQAFPQAIELLRSESIRCYRIDIETDSTLAGNDQKDQEQAIQFINILTQGLNDTLPVIQAVPQSALLLTEAISMVARKFKAGRGLEDALDQFAQAINDTAAKQLQPPMPEGQPEQPGQQPQAGPQPPQAPPQIDPRIIQSQNEAESRMARLQAEAQLKEAQMQLDYLKHQDRMRIEEGNLAVKQAEEDRKRQETLVKLGGLI